MKRIISFSGGKDSTAMLLRMIELGIPIDEVRYFDCGSWEFPQMVEHIRKVERIIPIPITRMRYKYNLDYLFSEKITRKGNTGYGFPTMVYRWCTGKKRDTLVKGMERHKTVQYIGYTIDELQRMGRSTVRSDRRGIQNRFPLIEWGWSEKDCLEYCYSKGFDWGGLYNYFDRVSCWCCPFQGIRELRNLRKFFPGLWARLLDMQTESWNAFKMDGTTVFDFDKRFAEEDRQMELSLA